MTPTPPLTDAQVIELLRTAKIRVSWYLTNAEQDAIDAALQRLQGWQFTSADYLQEAEALDTQIAACAADRAEWAKDGHWNSDEPCDICTLQRDHAAMFRDAATHAPPAPGSTRPTEAE